MSVRGLKPSWGQYQNPGRTCLIENMCSLDNFPRLPPEGEIVVCEMNGQVHSMNYDRADAIIFTTSVSSNPKVNITKELLHTSLNRQDTRRVFLPVSENIFKRLVNICYENGLYEALETAAEPDNVTAFPVVGFIATHLLRVANVFTSIRYTLHPHLRELGDNLIAAVSETRNWAHSPVRCLSWHPHCTKLALATLDDSVRIYSCDTPTRIIKCKTQRGIACVAWRPLTSLVLAVGCDKGVFVWSLDPTSMATRPTTNCATLLKRPHHTPVTGVTWSPQGDLLLTSSATDTTMYVWDVELEEFSPVRRVDGGGVNVVSWSPCSTKLFSATTGTTFRVWDTSQWTADRWNVISGRVQTACWSPCGSVVLFCTTTEPLIYSLFVTKLFSLSTPLYQEQPSELLQSALIAADLTLILTEDGHTVGGLVVSMAWDNKGCRLAVLFRDSPLVAVFRSSVTPTGANLAPCAPGYEPRGPGFDSLLVPWVFFPLGGG
uniref:Aladin seven-bladed propeller domain-containing protein n=1 Tax=Timema genevievae TaxID=629358 RepID=A0A7R9PLX9_TIMGE|nr:unnamed protein product [Timema genevievae]